MADITAPEYISPYVVTTAGGLVLDRDVYTMPVGAASVLQNFEPSVKGGYRRLSGTSKYDSAEVDDSDATILGVAIFNNKVIAAQGTLIEESSGSGWTSIDTGRSGALRYRFEEYTFLNNENRLAYVDDTNYASFYNGTTVVDIKGATSSASTTLSSTGSISDTTIVVSSAAGIAVGMYATAYTDSGLGTKLVSSGTDYALNEVQVTGVSGTSITLATGVANIAINNTSHYVSFAGKGTAPTDPSLSLIHI
mgnify:FL=1